jgi:hypothetical protein
MTDQKSGLNQCGSGTLLARLIVCLLPALVNAKYALRHVIPQRVRSAKYSHGLRQLEASGVKLRYYRRLPYRAVALARRA